MNEEENEVDHLLNSQIVLRIDQGLDLNNLGVTESQCLTEMELGDLEHRMEEGSEEMKVEDSAVQHLEPEHELKELAMAPEVVLLDAESQELFQNLT